MNATIQLFYAPTSPYVRKVMVCAAELGLMDRIETLASAAHPIRRDTRIAAFNPLAKVPAARLPDGTLLFDSRVICEYLDDTAGGGLFPRGPERWPALTRQALGDGLLDAALLVRYEDHARSEAERSPAWREGQMVKIAAALDHMDETLSAYRDAVDIGSITIACALGYLDFRFPALDWRGSRPNLAGWYAKFAERPSMRETAPFDPV